MRHLTASILLVCATAASGQSLPETLPARHHFLAAARRGHPLGQYNLAMMLIHGEGGPPSLDEACALLLTSAVSVQLARVELGRCEAATSVTRASPP
jgi:hypothetical protein